MGLKQDLLFKGYLPEGLPPAFHSGDIAQYFVDHPAVYLTDDKKPVRSAVYNASKRGISRRGFSAVHPVTAQDLAEFLEKHSYNLAGFFADNPYSCSLPEHTPDGERAVRISTHNQLEEQRLKRHSGYRFIAKTDASRYYHSIYTHSVPWAFHGKAAAKKVRKHDSDEIYFNRLDFTLRQGQDGQTIGIPVGPDASRYVAELIGIAVDREFRKRCGVDDFCMIRHVDDVWIGANTHADAEQALWRYRECLRDFELDVNENKTRIYAENFRFTDAWPSDVSNRLELATNSAEQHRRERLRAALEYAFDLSVSDRDDGILKFAIRHLDHSEGHWDPWSTLQPFLMRAAVHFGHTIDYVARVLIWRKLTKDDLDKSWSGVIQSLLHHHSRLGNDSEVCWLLFTASKLRIPIPDDVASNIVRNCGALSIVAVLNCVADGLAQTQVFDNAFEILCQESGNGPFWPVFLEWASKDWPRHDEIKKLVKNEVIQGMSDELVFIFKGSRSTRVFDNIEPSNFASILSAIESRVSSYEG